MGARDVFSQRGGVRIGQGLFFAFNASWPLARLEIRETALLLSCWPKRWHFPKERILALHRHAGGFSDGLRIEHDGSPYARFIVFWTSDFDTLRIELDRRGYAVQSD